jgi:hypothetical protein
MCNYNAFGNYVCIEDNPNLLQCSTIAPTITRNCKTGQDKKLIKYTIDNDKHRGFPKETDTVTCCACVNSESGHVYNSACDNTARGKWYTLNNQYGNDIKNILPSKVGFEKRLLDISSAILTNVDNITYDGSNKLTKYRFKHLYK